MTYFWVAFNIFFSVWCWRSSTHYFEKEESFAGWYLILASAANAAAAAAMVF